MQEADLKKVVARAAVLAALLSTASVAYAADVVAPEEPAPIVETPIFSWTGAYIGIVGGYNWGKTDWTFTDTGDNADFDTNGGSIGGTVGYNYQLPNNIVLGLEADVSWSGADGSVTCPNPAFSCDSEVNWYGTVRPRLGYAYDRFLPYITGGAAFGNVELTTRDTVTGDSVSDDQTRFGWAAGVGLEYAFTDQLTAKVEYLHIDLGKDDYTLSGGAPAEAKWKSDGVRIGLNYKF